ncbi:MAG: aminotransferase class V-fold PLP-dependent enzyme [Candidatus Krumholzibacteriota bacterium]|nr:aminotransferase class V-fold PLP-dependent enzyme [Candidatus Krumholzibacteriota bacterium]
MAPARKRNEPEARIPEVIGARHEVALLDGRLVEAVYLDNAASTKPFREVSDFIKSLEPYYSNIHRSTGHDSLYITGLYEEARRIILGFVGADPDANIMIPVRNATEGLNLLAMTMDLDPRRDVVISSMLEHHSNDLPWRGKAKVEYIPIDDGGDLDLEFLRRRLRHHDGAVKVVAVTGASNVLGTVTPIHEIAALAHEHGARIVVDAAQLAPHRPVRVFAEGDPRHIDYLVFCAHKMNSPYGEGAVIGPFKHFKDAAPYLQGGGTVYSVDMENVIWADPPDKQEAGTPNVFGMLAMAKAIRVMQRFGMDSVIAHEQALTRRLLAGLAEIPRVEIFGRLDPDDLDQRLGVVSFDMPGRHHALVAAVLSYEGGISVRSGCFCAHPLIRHLLHVEGEAARDLENALRQGDRRRVPGMVRVSVGLHNRDEDIERLLAMLRIIDEERWQGRYIQESLTGEYRPEGFRFDFRSLPGFD